MGVYLDYIKTPSGVLKLLEILSVIVAFGLFRGSEAIFKSPTSDADYFGCGVLVTALIITPLLLICYLMGRIEIQKTIFEMVFNLLVSVFLLAVGCVGIDTWNVDVIYDKHNIKGKSLAMASFCIIAFLFYLADTVFAVINYRK
ncbi:protein snakeskin-like [Panulirus ornatus]|uniref:protein snakeskin-like n=1 Tax=Panulirus ornatus TaxID=150431 RepID=UPI003A8411A5